MLILMDFDSKEPQINAKCTRIFSLAPIVLIASVKSLLRWAVAAGLGEKGMSSNVARKSIWSWIILDEIPLIVV